MQVAYLDLHLDPSSPSPSYVQYSVIVVVEREHAPTLIITLITALPSSVPLIRLILPVLTLALDAEGIAKRISSGMIRILLLCSYPSTRRCNCVRLERSLGEYGDIMFRV